MEKILARRSSPFNFFFVPGFPNVVPTVDEWGDYLPIFRAGCVTEQVAYYKFYGVCRLAYEHVKEYMELYLLHVLKPPSFILTSSLGGKLKNVTVLLSWLDSLLSITERVNKFTARKLLEWLWWKFAFT
jgi:hypothetical protein